jgi:histone deacetylase complex regulatory component SIN3
MMMSCLPWRVYPSCRLTNLLKNTYSTDSETYKQFLKILTEYFEAVRADSEPGERDERMIQAVDQIKVLFQGNDELIQGLETFKPDGSK